MQPPATLTAAYLEQRLPKPLRTKEGEHIETIGGARDYMLEVLPINMGDWQCWQRVCKLMLEQAPPATVGDALESALFLTFRLEL